MIAIKQDSLVTTQISKTRRLPALDLLRGGCTLIVIAIHTSEAFPTRTAILDFWIGLGLPSIQMFYFISVFTMCYLWNNKKYESYPVFNFYVRRFFRIVPLFWIFIPISLGIYGFGKSYFAPQGIGPLQIVLTFLFLHGFWPDSINSVVSGGWSIAAETTFYAVFPLLMLYNKKWSKNRNYLYLAIFIYFSYNLIVCESLKNLLAKYYLTSSSTIIKDFLYLNFLSQAPIFIFGCFLFSKIDQISEITKSIPALLAWLIAAFFLREYFSLGEKQFIFLFVIYITGLIVYISVYWNIGFRPLEEIGKNSYAMYLTHSMVIYGIGVITRKLDVHTSGIYTFLAVFIAAVFISYLLALILHIAVESKAHHLAESLVAWREERRIKS